MRKNTINRFGPVREVQKTLVVELAFDSAHVSSRHKSGIALRFPRINRIRWDKPAKEADTLESVYEPYLLQEGFIQRTPRGRMATAHAYAYLGVTPPTEGVGQGNLFRLPGEKDSHKSA